MFSNLYIPAVCSPVSEKYPPHDHPTTTTTTTTTLVKLLRFTNGLITRLTWTIFILYRIAFCVVSKISPKKCEQRIFKLNIVLIFCKYFSWSGDKFQLFRSQSGSTNANVNMKELTYKVYVQNINYGG